MGQEEDAAVCSQLMGSNTAWGQNTAHAPRSGWGQTVCSEMPISPFYQVTPPQSLEASIGFLPFAIFPSLISSGIKKDSHVCL